MAQRKVRKQAGTVTDRLPELLAAALSRHDDFIVTRETDEESGRERIHVIAGKFVTSCMLRKLIGQAESQKDEGAVLLSGRWQSPR